MAVQRVWHAAFLSVLLIHQGVAASFYAFSATTLKAVSDDGTVLAGVSGYPGEAILHTAGSTTRLGDLPGGDLYSAAWGISGDGQVVVGTGTGSLGEQAVIWTRGVLSPLPFLPGRSGPSIAYAASYDGSTVVGASQSTYGLAPVRWDAGKISPLSLLPGMYHAGKANDISSDGRFIAGTDAQWNGTQWVEQAVLWRNGVIVALGDLPGGVFNSHARGVSDDGTVVVGRGASSSRAQEAFRWENGVMTALGCLPGDSSSMGNGVSADGRRVVGQSGSRAFLWEAGRGMRDLREVLVTDYGLSLGGWTLYGAEAITPSGRFITGWGRTPSGALVGWVAEIPEPCTLVLALLATGFLSRSARQGARQPLFLPAARA